MVEELVELFPELTKESANIFATEVFNCLVRAVHRGDTWVIPRLLSLKYHVRSRPNGQYTKKPAGAGPVKIAKMRLSDELRAAVGALPMTEEEITEWRENREKNLARHAKEGPPAPNPKF